MALLNNFRDGTYTVTDATTLSETVPNIQGEWSLATPTGGAEIEEYQSQGEFIGARYGAAAAVELTLSWAMTTPIDDCLDLMRGTASGFTSVWASNSDVPFFNCSIDVSKGASTRIITLARCFVPQVDKATGSPGTQSVTIRCLGTVTETSADGTVRTIITRA
jgi:hypothetical protein